MSKIANIGRLKNYTIFITGASRGIGLSIGKKCAADGYVLSSISFLYTKINRQKLNRHIST